MRIPDEMTKEEARSTIKYIIASETVITASLARQLYIRAELPMPEHLKIKPNRSEPYTGEFLGELEKHIKSELFKRRKD